jgi:hypothetical protein
MESRRQVLLFDEILSKIPVKSWYRLYKTMHEVGDETLYDNIMQIMGIDKRWVDPPEGQY